MRTESEMHDLVVAKVAAHRRRTVLASAGGGVAIVLLLVAVVAGATGSRPGETVEAGEGDRTTTTTETTTTTTAASTSTTSTSTTTAPPATAPPATAPGTDPAPTGTEPPPTTVDPAPTTTAPPGPEPTVTVVPMSSGDLSATFTITTDPARPGMVRIRFQITDPTGVDVHDDGYRVGPGADAALILPADPWSQSLARVGDTVASCGHGDLEGTEPGSLDETVEVAVPSGRQTIRLVASTLHCHEEGDQAFGDHVVEVP